MTIHRLHDHLMPAILAVLAIATSTCWAVTAGKPGKGELVVAEGGKTRAMVVVSPDAKKPEGPLSRDTYANAQAMVLYERAAAEELVRCIELMTGAKPAIADTPDAITAALKEKIRPVLIVGSEAIKADKSLSAALKKVAKPQPKLRADAIVVRRAGNRVYLAGLTGDGHYHAVVELLERWGCHWYLPTAFGECIPDTDRLTVGKLDYAYASPFELRSYWIAWNGDGIGYTEFLLHNRMTRGVTPPPASHALGSYIKELVPPGKSIFQIPISEDKTADHVAAKLDTLFRDNGMASVAIEDGLYTSESAADRQLQAGMIDKYFYGMPVMSDPFLTLYNKVCERLLQKYPQSTAKLGFLAYTNMTIPPQQVEKAASPLFCSMAPIDIDPNHGMDDVRAPSRQEYRDIMYRWAKVVDGRMYIRDYDQGALVWRDIPDPSHQAFRQDVQHYAKAGVTGFFVESRSATATTFLNHYLRAQLMWNPKTDVDAQLAQFYPAFYGPAAEPMSKYWGAIYQAWEKTITSEHEFFIIPAIYTPALIEELRGYLVAAEQAVFPLKTNKIVLTRNEQLYLERMRFTRLAFDVLDGYTGMLAAGAGECDYAGAAARGQKALAARAELQKMNGTFVNTTMGENGPAWFPGEVQLYADLGKLTAGPDGKLVTLLPLEWAFRRDPNDTGLASGFAYRAPNLTYWNANKGRFATPESRKDYPTTEWELLRTDQYMQAQGVLHPDWQSFTGFAWYQTTATINAADAAANVHIRFPGLFNECWLYVNGNLVAHREQAAMWWNNDYAFNWDVPLAGTLKAGENTIVLRCNVQHHLGGMFRRPFLYQTLNW